MKCRLCDRPTAGTGKLCEDCTTSMRRARARSAVQRAPPAARSDQVEAVATTSERSLPRPMAALAPLRRRNIAWVAIGLIVIGTAYLGQRESARPPASERVAVDRAPASTPESSRVDASTVGAQAVSMPSDAPLAPAPSTPALAAVSRGAQGGTPATKENRGSKASPPPSTLANEKPARKANGEPPSDPESAQLMARSSASPSVSPADGGPSYASAIEKCGTEGLLSRFICEQKMYLQYCEDKWDKDPRCMRRTSSN
jgi:hypothetical protein